MNYDCDAVSLGLLLKEIEKYSDKYDFMISPDPEGNSVWLRKDGIDLYDYGGHVSLVHCIEKILQYLYRINQTPEEQTIFYKIQNEA